MSTTHAEQGARRTPPGLAVMLDALAVLVFAAAGMRSHDEGSGAAEVLVIAWPFLVGAAVGWSGLWIVRSRLPLAAPLAGVWVMVDAVVVGHLLRLLTGRGSAWSFVLVSAIVLSVLLVGWRLVAQRLGRHTPSSS